MPKKKWEKPKLIVIVRGDRQEENVLSACKVYAPGIDLYPTTLYEGDCVTVLNCTVQCSVLSAS